MKRRVDVYFTSQAEVLLEKMPDVDREKLLDWFLEIKGVQIGGGDIIDYLNYLKQ